MKAKITGELIAQGGLQWYGFDITAERAAEIARDVDRVNDAVLAAEPAGDFNDAPGDFMRVLALLKSAKARR